VKPFAKADGANQAQRQAKHQQVMSGGPQAGAGDFSREKEKKRKLHEKGKQTETLKKNRVGGGRFVRGPGGSEVVGLKKGKKGDAWGGVRSHEDEREKDEVERERGRRGERGCALQISMS